MKFENCCHNLTKSFYFYVVDNIIKKKYDFDVLNKKKKFKDVDRKPKQKFYDCPINKKTHSLG